MTHHASFITDPTDRAAFERHLTKLRLLGVALDARASAGRLHGSRAQIADAIVSIRALRNIVAIEQTRRRVAARERAA